MKTTTRFFVTILLLAFSISLFAQAQQHTARVGQGYVFSNPNNTMCNLQFATAENPTGGKMVSTYEENQALRLTIASNCSLYIYLLNIDAAGNVNILGDAQGQLVSKGIVTPNAPLQLPPAGEGFRLRGSGKEVLLILGTAAQLTVDQLGQFNSAVKQTYPHVGGATAQDFQFEFTGVLAPDWTTEAIHYFINMPSAVTPISPVQTNIPMSNHDVAATAHTSYQHLPQSSSPIIPLQSNSVNPVLQNAIDRATVLQVSSTTTPVHSNPITVNNFQQIVQEIPAVTAPSLNFTAPSSNIRLHIISTPGAEVVVNEQTPIPATSPGLYIADVIPGQYVVRATYPGYYARVGTAIITGNEAQPALDLRLSEIPPK